MFFTVAVSVYNAGQFLDQCIESVIMQENNDYELLLVDDGSTDHSLMICEKWRSKYPYRIRIVHKDNEGSLLTRRRCLFESKGEFIYLMDADDYLVDNRFLGEARDIILSNNSDLLIFNVTTNENNEKFYQFEYQDGQIFENEDRFSLYRLAIEGDSMNPLWNKIFSRKLIDWNGEYPTDYKMSNATDRYQMLPILFNAQRIVYWDKVEYYYRKENDGSIVHQFNPLIFKSTKASFIRLCEICSHIDFSKHHYDIEVQLDRRIMMIVCACVNKIRLARQIESKKIALFLSEIANDPEYRDRYSIKSIKSLPLKKIMVLFLLYHRKYRTLIRMLCLLQK